MSLSSLGRVALVDIFFFGDHHWIIARRPKTISESRTSTDGSLGACRFLNMAPSRNGRNRDNVSRRMELRPGYMAKKPVDRDGVAQSPGKSWPASFFHWKARFYLYFP